MEFPERMRGHISIRIEDCITCGLCARACPSLAIQVDRKAGTWTISRFDCVQCGSCVLACPKKCLTMEKGYTEPDIMKKSDTVVKPQEEKKEAARDGAAAGRQAGDGCGEVRILYALCEEMPAGSDPGRPEGKDLGAGRRKMRGVRDLRGSVPEESDRDERVRKCRSVESSGNCPRSLLCRRKG